MLTTERKNTILNKLKAMPDRQWRGIDPNDLDQREAIKFIIDNDQLPGFEVEFNTTYSKVIKREKLWKSKK